jgi:sigma-E factor negative regulatory protein RseC
MTEYGEVVEVTDGIARVRFQRTAACEKCGACGLQSNQYEIVVEMPNDLGTIAGDLVTVNIKANKALKATVIAYIFPLFMLFAGVFVGWLLSSVLGVFSDTEITMAVCGIIFAVLSFLLLKLAYPLYNKTVSNVYTMVSKKER